MPTHPDTDIITPQPKAAHTPGPWQIVRYGDGDSLVIHSDADTRVCFMATPGQLGPSFAHIKANATLIAAAPTMLAALRLALPELAEDLIALVDSTKVGGAGDWQPEEPLPADLWPEAPDMLRGKKAAYDAVLAAIKQAEGRA